MAYVGWCLCQCHSALLGNAHALMHGGDSVRAAAITERPEFDKPLWTSVHDVLEAAVATGCSCIANHAPALSTRKPPRPPYKPPSNWKPSDDAE